MPYKQFVDDSTLASDGLMINYNWKSAGLDSWTDDQAQS